MGKEKLPEREQGTDEREKLTLRLNADMSGYLKKKANVLGIPQNAFLTMLVDMGLRYYEGELTISCQSPQK